MKLYLAGLANFGGGRFESIASYLKEARYLESYHYKKAAQYCIDNRLPFFLDSGAFSAASLGIKIDLDAYCRFIEKNSPQIEVAAVLDVIGDPDGTWANMRLMESRGLKPLPVFHFGSDLTYLDYCLAYPRFALGGLVGFAKQRAQLFEWLDRCWERICDSSGKPRSKIHGFGMTGFEVMQRYPWDSVDSTSWAQGSKQGAILVKKGNSYQSLVVANDAQARRELDQHFYTMPKLVRSGIVAEVESRGWEMEVLTGDKPSSKIRDYDARAAYNCQVYLEIAAAHQVKTFVKSSQGLFDA